MIKLYIWFYYRSKVKVYKSNQKKVYKHTKKF